MRPRDTTIPQLYSRPFRRSVPEQEHRTQRFRHVHEARKLGFDSVQQRVLQQQVVDRIRGQAKLGEEHQIDVARLAVVHHRQRLGRVGGGIADLDARRAGGDTDEALPVQREEFVGHRDNGQLERSSMRF